MIDLKKHRFPNLASMKISGYHKEKKDDVQLILNYDELENDDYDIIYVSKVFEKTSVPEEVLKNKNVKIGGTGFFYDKAKFLPYYIEHHMPDYHLYDEYIQKQLENPKNDIKDFQYYIDYSIGFTTRGCIRGCEFCVNKNYKTVYKHSPIEEFLDESRKYICLLDDNILAYKNWEDVFIKLNSTNKRFQYKQGMDFRLLNDDKIKYLKNSKYIGDYIFAFDNILDKDIIESKLPKYKSIIKRTTKFYVLCAFDREDKYDDEFWKNDITDLFKRIKILMNNKCLPYIMRYKNYSDSPYRTLYINVASWCNQPNFFKKMSFREFCMANQDRIKTKDKLSSALDSLITIENKYPEIAKEFFDMKYE